MSADNGRKSDGTFATGNKASKRVKVVQQIIEGAIRKDDGRRLREGIDKVLDLAADGDRWAIEYLTDRLDGKAKQSVDVSSEDGSMALFIANAEALRSKIRGENAKD